MSPAVLSDDKSPLLELSRDAARINGFVNHPDVREGIGHKDLGAIDLAGFVEIKEHMFFVGEHGGFGALWRAPDVYEIHTFIVPAGRGLWAIRAAREAIAVAKSRGARMLWTCVPVGRPEIDFFTRSMGFRATGQVLEVLGVPHKIYKLGEI
jgi:hypothetical protein